MGICPLREISASIDLAGGVEFSDASCLEEKCAWWDNESGTCMILILAKTILGKKGSDVNPHSKTENKSFMDPREKLRNRRFRK